MKAALKLLIAVIVITNLTSCSCAIEHAWLEAKDGGKITGSSFQAAAKDSGFKASGEGGHGYHKRGVYLRYPPKKRILIHSTFCPTPITLITWGADARAWESRCNKVESSLFSWYAQRGITLERVNPPLTDE